VTGILRHHDGDSFVRCYLCGGDAAGPCMKCRRSVCGNCCVLVQGVATPWAVCTVCEGSDAPKVGGWRGLGLFFGKIVLVLIVLIAFLAWLAGDLG
jgi:hypothetical protein